MIFRYAGCICTMIIFAIPFLLLGMEYIIDHAIWMMVGGICCVFLIFPHLVGWGLFGICCIGMGFGDYLNVYNAIRQIPKNATITIQKEATS